MVVKLASSAVANRRISATALATVKPGEIRAGQWLVDAFHDGAGSLPPWEWRSRWRAILGCD